MVTTIMMDAMLQQLNTFSDFPVSVGAPQPLSSRSSIAPSRTSFYDENPLNLTPSTLCQACQAVFDGRNLSLIPRYTLNQSRTNESSQRRTGEIPHHGLDDLATRAARGCHLCLTVYLSLDPDTLRAFRRKSLNSSKSISSSTAGKKVAPGQENDTTSTASLGFASVTPIARDQAKISFRYIKAATSQSSTTLDSAPQAGQFLELTNFLATFEKDEDDPLGLGFGPGFSGLGQTLTSRNGSNSSLPTPTETSNEDRHRGSSESKHDDDLSLTVELILLNPRCETRLIGEMTLVLILIDAVEPGVRTIPKTSDNTGSPQSFEVAKKWIEDCTFHHIKCLGNEDSPIWKPTHLLDVGVKGPNGVPGVRLVDGMFLDPLTEYVTLSHCWGRIKPVRLHKGTLPALRQGVAQSNLPKTFSDAAQIAERLGFRYLWIDALCIMHDNEQAVLKEVSQMHRIYSEASLNIAASGSREDTAGMLYARNVQALQPCVVEVQGYSIDDGTYKILRSTIWDDLVDNSPLSRRAWALQERALAKRTLHFTRTEMMWECQQMCCSEVYPKGLPVTMATLATQESLRNGWGKKIPIEEKFNKRTHHTRTGNWKQLVRIYSAGKLSYRSDKLMAIGGLARQYLTKNRMKESDYIAGLWRPQIPYGLLWKVEKGRRPSKYRAPTWSWASCEGLIEIPEGAQTTKQTCLEIIDVQVKNKGGDPFGMCESARLKVRGFMARGLLPRTQDYWNQSACSIKFPQSEVTFASASFDDRLPKLSDNIGIMTETLEVYLLPVIDLIERVEGLILTATMKKGEFRRIGTFELSINDVSNWDAFKSVMKGDPDMTNYEERLDHTNAYWFASDYTYTITLL